MLLRPQHAPEFRARRTQNWLVLGLTYAAMYMARYNFGFANTSLSAIYGSMIQSGRAAVFALMTTSLVVALPWQWKFFLPAIVVGVMALLTVAVVRDTPRDAGLPDFDPEDATSGDREKVTFGYVARRVCTNPVALTIAASEFCTGLVRKGFEEWFPRYMREAQHLPLDHPLFRTGATA